MSSVSNIQSDNSAFTPFEKNKYRVVSSKLPEIDQPVNQPQMKEAIKSARQNRKMIFNNIRMLFKENVTRVWPCLKENE